jgi:putative transposase
MMEELPKRRRPAAGVIESKNGPTIVFDTVCLSEKIGWLANGEIHTLLRNIWQNASAWLVGRYVIMPDHIHYFASPSFEPVPFENWVRFWKSQFTKRYKIEHAGKCPPVGWQSNHWDTRMRNGQSYEEKWEYVRTNPVRRGLVISPEDWLYQGELNEIRSE